MMGKVYRYIDIRDNFIKYVGIVYGENRTLEQRHKEHIKNEIWCDENFIVQYLDIPVNNRTEAETLESHFISLYGSGKWYNKSKSNWGQSSFLPQFDENDWQELDYVFTSQDIENIKRKRINSNQNNNLLNNEKLNKIIEKLDILIENNINSFESINRLIKYDGLDNKEILIEKLDALIKDNKKMSESVNKIVMYSELDNIENTIKDSVSQTFSNTLDSMGSIAKGFNSLKSKNDYWLDQIHNVYSKFDNIQESLSNEIGNIRDKISISLSEEINNKVDSINEKFKDLDKSKDDLSKLVSEFKNEFNVILGNKYLWRLVCIIAYVFMFIKCKR